MSGLEGSSAWDQYIAGHPADALIFERYEPTETYPITTREADPEATLPDCMPAIQEPRYRHTEVFPDAPEERKRVIDQAFADWFLKEDTKGAFWLSQELQVLLSQESLSPGIQPDAQFDKWIKWMHLFTDSAATLMYVMPQALSKIQDNSVAEEYASRILLDPSVVTAWRPMPEAEDERVEMLTWSARFVGTQLGAHINDIMDDGGIAEQLTADSPVESSYE